MNLSDVEFNYALMAEYAAYTEWLVSLTVGDRSRSFTYKMGSAYNRTADREPIPPRKDDVIGCLASDAELYQHHKDDLDGLAYELGWSFPGESIRSLLKTQAELKSTYRKCLDLFGADSNGRVLIPEVPF